MPPSAAARIRSRPIRGLAALLLVAAASPAAPPPGESLERRVAAAAGGTLTVELSTGGNFELQGWDQPAVAATATLRGRDWSDTKVSLVATKSGARFEAVSQAGDPRGKSTSHAFSLRVPRRYNLVISSDGGNITLRDVTGSFTGATAGGSLVLEDVGGTARLTTRGGNVEVRRSTFDGSVETRAGSVFLDRAPDGAAIRTGAGDVGIGPCAGDIVATTGYGDVDIGPASGSVQVETGTGDVAVTIADGNSVPSVRVRAGIGTVEIELPAGFRGEFDLDAGYTELFGRAAVIKSDWAVPLENDLAWVANGGTPRRHVRTHAKVGGGGSGRVHVRTTNGDIRIVRRAAAAAP